MVPARKSRWKKRLQIKIEVACLSLVCDVTKLDIEPSWMLEQALIVFANKGIVVVDDVTPKT